MKDDLIEVKRGRGNSRQPLRNKPGAYVVTHTPTGQEYVGSAKNLSGRESEHRSMLKHNKHSCPPMQELYNSDPNIENYQFRCLPTETREEAFDIEQKWIDERKDSGRLLNVGTNTRSWRKGVPFTDEQKELLRKARTGFKTSEEVRAASAAHLAKYRNGSTNGAAKEVEVNGVTYGTIREAAAANGMNEDSMRWRLKSDRYPNAKFKDK